MRRLRSRVELLFRRPPEKQERPRLQGLSSKRMMGLEPTTFCMAITVREATGADRSRHSACLGRISDVVSVRNRQQPDRNT